MDRSSDFITQHLANLIINEQFLIWNKNNLDKYKKIYSTSKAWIFLKLSLTPLYLNSSHYLLYKKSIS